MVAPERILPAEREHALPDLRRDARVRMEGERVVLEDDAELVVAVLLTQALERRDEAHVERALEVGEDHERDGREAAAADRIIGADRNGRVVLRCCRDSSRVRSTDDDELGLRGGPRRVRAARDERHDGSEGEDGTGAKRERAMEGVHGARARAMGAPAGGGSPSRLDHRPCSCSRSTMPFAAATNPWTPVSDPGNASASPETVLGAMPVDIDETEGMKAS
jgi:hypothetical protein